MTGAKQTLCDFHLANLRVLNRRRQLLKGGSLSIGYESGFAAMTPYLVVVEDMADSCAGVFVIKVDVDAKPAVAHDF